ncbi:peptidoglycan hydrolase-like protein with peptidoglycan-binding domain [Arthrobacter sp. AZCC_0090]|nr:peptidoglycan hydrolase-like protein with peptidoglycan-binding domain [Arthrobacter sp. AZCC_0090]
MTQNAAAVRIERLREEVWSPAQASDAETSREVQISMDWQDGSKLYAPAWDGVVQAVHLRTGEAINDGDKVAVVNGISRLAVHTETPFFGELRVGDVGPEVSKLNAVLTRLGFGNPVGDRYSSSTAAFVRQLQIKLGVRPASGETFSSSWFVFLPSEAVSVGSTHLIQGTMAPTFGAEVASELKQVSNAVLVMPGTVSKPATDATEPGAETSKTPPIPQTPKLEALPQERLFLGEIELELNADRQQLSNSGKTTLRTLVQEGARATDARLKAPSVKGSLRVPSAAVFASKTDKTCVISRELDGTKRSKRVAIISSSAGQTVITADISPGQYVEISPSIGDRSCE